MSIMWFSHGKFYSELLKEVVPEIRLSELAPRKNCATCRQISSNLICNLHCMHIKKLRCTTTSPTLSYLHCFLIHCLYSRNGTSMLSVPNIQHRTLLHNKKSLRGSIPGEMPRLAGDFLVCFDARRSIRRGVYNVQIMGLDFE